MLGVVPDYVTISPSQVEAAVDGVGTAAATIGGQIERILALTDALQDGSPSSSRDEAEYQKRLNEYNTKVATLNDQLRSKMKELKVLEDAIKNVIAEINAISKKIDELNGQHPQRR
jgi:septal ring factor EnvC (AmiA/AmiB activator)